MKLMGKKNVEHPTSNIERRIKNKKMRQNQGEEIIQKFLYLDFEISLTFGLFNLDFKKFATCIC